MTTKLVWTLFSHQSKQVYRKPPQSLSFRSSTTIFNPVEDGVELEIVALNENPIQKIMTRTTPYAYGVRQFRVFLLSLISASAGKYVLTKKEVHKSTEDFFF